MATKCKLKKGDSVIVRKGKKTCKGKIGKIINFTPDKKRVFVEGINMVKEYVRPNPQKNIQGGIVEKEGSLPIASVMFYDANAEQGVRIGYKFENGKKVRISKKTGKVID